MKKCLVKDCPNHAHEGTFIGELCAPCHTMLTTLPVKQLMDAVRAIIRDEKAIDPWLLQRRGR
jgi:hypothetical protein